MGNSLLCACADSSTKQKAKDDERGTASGASYRCSCPETWKPVTFDTLFVHAEQVLPKYLGGANCQLFHNIYNNTRLSHKAVFDLLNINNVVSQKQYLLDLFWHGTGIKVCEKGHKNCVKGVENMPARGMSLSDYAQRFVGDLRCDPLQHYPNFNGLTVRYGRLEYVAERFTAGIHGANVTLGNDKFFEELNSKPDTVPKGNVGFQAMVGLNAALSVGVQCSHHFTMVGPYNAAHMENTVDFGARLSFPQDYLVVSAKVGGGELDLNITVCPLTNATFGIAVKTLLSNTEERSVRYGMKLDFPNEAMDVRIGMNSNQEIVVGARKKLFWLPVALVFTSVFGGEDKKSYKLGLGLQADL